MEKHDILVIGASAGGVETLKQLVRDLPGDLPASIFIVLHVPSYGKSRLPEIINRAGQLKAFHPEDGRKIEQGCIYIAPPDYHLIIKEGYIRLARGPRENNCRPAIDVLFRTAARIYGPRVLGVVLSGTLDDGTAGLISISQRGGVTVAQDPEEAMFDGMPRSAIENDHVNYILKLTEMAPVLIDLISQPVETGGVEAVTDEMKIETDMAELQLEAMQQSERPGKPSPYGCPECGGVLWELKGEKLLRFRCRTGHAYSSNSLLASQSEQLEEALWNALRALEEKASLSLRLAERAQKRQQQITARRFQEQGQDHRQKAALVRKLLLVREDDESLGAIDNRLLEGQDLATALKKGNLSTFQKLTAEGGHEQTPPIVGGKSVTLSQTELDEEPPVNGDLKIVALCASAGGLHALTEILSDLNADFPAAVAILQHLAPQYPSQLAGILARRTALSVKQAESGDVLGPGRVYIAPPGQHLLVNPDHTLSLSGAKLVHFLRPSADLLLESIAASFRQQAIAVILTGTGVDGAVGIQAIKNMGGIAIAQDEGSSEFFGMPRAAICTGSIDRIVPLSEIAAMLVQLVTLPKQAR